MKTRTGFVSNSSSSSFIVAFKEMPTSVEDIRELLFGESQNVEMTSYGENKGKLGTPTYALAARVYSDMVISGPSDEDGILRKLHYGGIVHEEWKEPEEEVRQEVDLVDQKYRELYGFNASMLDHEDWKEERDEASERDWSIRHAAERRAVWKFYSDVVVPLLAARIVFIFEYHDDHGEGVLEHGEIFKNLPHLMISHH